MPDPTPADQQNPTPEGQSGQTPPADQQTTGQAEGQTTGQTNDQTDGQTQEPFFTAKTKEEFESKYGNVRTEGKLAMAKAAGFETIAEYTAAAADFKKYQEDKKTDAQRQADQATQNAAIVAENKALKIEREAERQALQLGADPKQLDDLMKLRTVSDGEVADDGTVDTEAVKTSISQALETRPWLTAKPGGKTVGTAGSNPASGATEPTDIEAQIAEAQKANNHERAVALQMQKLFPNT